jgi:pectinesterase inhibitor-like protein
MTMKLLFSALSLLLIVSTCKSSTLEDTCRSFAAGHPSIGYDYCIKTFQANESSAAAADVRGLAAIVARIAEAKANATAARVAALSAVEKDAMRRARLGVCAEVYADAVDELGQAAEDIALGADDDGAEAALRDAVTQLSAALDAPGTCEDAFGEADGTSPLAAEDAEFKKLATIALAVAASLTPPPSSTPKPRISD